MKEKFAFISFNKISSSINEEIYISDEFKIYLKFPFQIDKHWQKWLGSLKVDVIADANLVIYCSSSTTNPEILDNEHIEIQRKVFDFFYSLILYGVPRYYEANMITGSIDKGKVSVREFTIIDQFYVVYGGKSNRITSSDIPAIYQIYNCLTSIFSDSTIKANHYFRLRHGLTAYFKALTERENYYRIPQLVRAIEAIIMPRIGNTKKNFAHRCKTFVKPNPLSESILSEIYELRNKVEHLHSLLEVYPDESEYSALEKINSRVRMLEVLARDVLNRIIMNPNLLELFFDNDTIQKFWSLPDCEREKIWGSKLKLETIL